MDSSISKNKIELALKIILENVDVHPISDLCCWRWFQT
ncbi:unnamed protein product [uncultured virus]|nr:unnamed protein product [uncultured virus]